MSVWWAMVGVEATCGWCGICGLPMFTFGSQSVALRPGANVTQRELRASYGASSPPTPSSCSAASALNEQLLATAARSFELTFGD